MLGLRIRQSSGRGDVVAVVEADSRQGVMGMVMVYCTSVSLLGNTSQLESCSAAHQAMVSTPTAAAATLDTTPHTR